jgi:hypothetical protein
MQTQFIFFRTRPLQRHASFKKRSCDIATEVNIHWTEYFHQRICILMRLLFIVPLELLLISFEVLFEVFAHILKTPFSSKGEVRRMLINRIFVVDGGANSWM